jgi:hypothetical protein
VAFGIVDGLIFKLVFDACGNFIAELVGVV